MGANLVTFMGKGRNQGRCGLVENFTWKMDTKAHNLNTNIQLSMYTTYKQIKRSSLKTLILSTSF